MDRTRKDTSHYACNTSWLQPLPVLRLAQARPGGQSRKGCQVKSISAQALFVNYTSRTPEASITYHIVKTLSALTSRFRGIVIATDTEYVARGAAEYMPSWRNELTGDGR